MPGGAPSASARGRNPATAGFVVVPLVALQLLAPAAARGERPGECRLTPRAGAAFAAGELAEEVGKGWTVGLDGACPLGGRLAVGGVGEYESLEGGAIDYAQLTILAVVDIAVLGDRRSSNGWDITLRAGAGGALAGAGGSRTLLAEPRLELIDGGLVTAVGLRTGVRVGPDLRLRLEAAWRALHAYTGDERTIQGGVNEGFGRVHTFPVTIGLEIGL